MVGRSGSNRRPTDCEASQSRRSAAIFARFVLSCCWWLVDPRRGSLSIWCATQVPRRFGPQGAPVQSLLAAARRVTRGVATNGPRTVGQRPIAASREVISRLRSSGSWRESTACGASQGTLARRECLCSTMALRWMVAWVVLALSDPAGTSWVPREIVGVARCPSSQGWRCRPANQAPATVEALTTSTNTRKTVPRSTSISHGQ